jgi:WD40 repeat protein
MRPAILLLLLASALRAEPPALDPYGDPLPEGAIARIGSIRNVRNGLLDTAMTPDGSRFVANEVGSLVVRKTRSFAEVRTIRLPEFGRNWGVAISADGKRVAAVVGLPVKGDLGTSRKSAVVWDVAGGERLCEVELTVEPYDRRPRVLTLTADGKRLATMGRLIDVDAGKVVRETPFNQNSAQLEFVADDRYLIDGDDKGWFVWDATTGEEVRREANRPQALGGGRRLARDGKFLVFARGGEVVRMRVEPPTADRPSMAFSAPARFPVGESLSVTRVAPDGKRVLLRDASAKGGPELLLFDFESKKIVDRLPEVKDYSFLHAATFTGNGAVLLIRPSYLHMPSVELAAVELPGGKNLTLERGLRFVDGELSWTPDGKRFRDARQSWDASTGACLDEPKPRDPSSEPWLPPDEPGKRVARVIHADGDRALILFLKSRQLGESGRPKMSFELQVWDIAARRKLHDLRAPAPDHRFFLQVSERGMSRDGGVFAMDLKNELFVWDLRTGRLIAHDAIDAASDADYSYLKNVLGRTGRELLCAPRGRLALFDIASRSVALDLKLDIPPGQTVPTFDWSPDGRLVALVDQNDQFQVYDLHRGARVWKAATKLPGVSAIQFSPDGRTILTQNRLYGLVWPSPKVEPFYQPLREEEFAAAWERLRACRADECRETLERLAVSGEAAAQFLGGKLEADPGPDPQKLDAAIARLQSDDSRKRTAAEKELRALDEVALPRLKKLLETGTADADLTERLNRLIEAPKDMAPPHSVETLRKLRGIAALESIRTESARKTLERLAKGAEGTAVTREAKSAMERTK